MRYGDKGSPNPSSVSLQEPERVTPPPSEFYSLAESKSNPGKVLLVGEARLVAGRLVFPR